VVIHLEKQQSSRITSDILQQAYARLKME